ncbi:SRPBCC family protein [Aquirhabdus parva]|uniref:Polyketide cyclase n=1 Tax=Aquirhabdus parva TaxID=2283318 RepID=A0A345P3L9_9GAMM|nr:SRPBCC family protein [Aquirhabdus parva]AXI01878.1 polyketide cyclase [Aquirhabdus parva]
MLILAIIIVIIAVVLLFAATKPDTFQLHRSIRISAPPERIFPLINDFHQWQSWSPWENIDPTMIRTFEGTPEGLGTIYSWAGQGKVGSGRMEITLSNPFDQIIIQLDFLKPFEAHNIAEFSIVNLGDSTEVTWEMRGPSPFIAKVMGLFFNMDRVVGKDFETGLANIKAIVEKTS